MRHRRGTKRVSRVDGRAAAGRRPVQDRRATMKHTTARAGAGGRGIEPPHGSSPAPRRATGPGSQAARGRCSCSAQRPPAVLPRCRWSRSRRARSRRCEGRPIAGRSVERATPLGRARQPRGCGGRVGGAPVSRGDALEAPRQRQPLPSRSSSWHIIPPHARRSSSHDRPTSWGTRGPRRVLGERRERHHRRPAAVAAATPGR